MEQFLQCMLLPDTAIEAQVNDMQHGPMPWGGGEGFVDTSIY